MPKGSLILIGGNKHIILDKFWVGFQKPNKEEVTKDYYYEIFSMDERVSKRRSAISCTDFEAGISAGNIRILSAA